MKMLISKVQVGLMACRENAQMYFMHKQVRFLIRINLRKSITRLGLNILFKILLKYFFHNNPHNKQIMLDNCTPHYLL